MIRIQRTLDSETLHLPEVKPLIGRTVEITVEEQVPEVRDEFYAETSQFPRSIEEFESQKAILQNWRSDSRFKPYWSLIDQRLTRSFEHLQKWAAIASQFPLEDYDYDAVRDQHTCDLEDAGRGMP
jgi:hypothetical protein